jgi:hypothetical protein
MVGLLLASAGWAQTPRAFLIEPELWLDGQAQTTPPVIVSVAEAARLFGGDDESLPQEGDWRLDLRADPIDDPLDLSQSLWVDVELSLFRAGQWISVLDSMLGVPEGEVSTLSVAPDGQAPTPDTAEVYLRLRTQKLLQAEGPARRGAAAPPL